MQKNFTSRDPYEDYVRLWWDVLSESNFNFIKNTVVVRSAYDFDYTYVIKQWRVSFFYLYDTKSEALIDFGSTRLDSLLSQYVCNW